VGGVLSFAVNPGQLVQLPGDSTNVLASTLTLPNAGVYILNGAANFFDGDFKNSMSMWCFIADNSGYGIQGSVEADANLGPTQSATAPLTGYYTTNLAQTTLYIDCGSTALNSEVQTVMTAIQVQ
jgi:hypothetical protein